MKYIVEYDEGDWNVTLDNPDYDGPVTNISDPEYMYHVDAASESEAVEIAMAEKAIDDGFVL